MKTQTNLQTMKQKAVLFGAGAVGKSALCLRYLKGTFKKKYEPTLEDKYFKQTEVDGENVLMEILDTAGQEDYYGLRNNYIHLYEGFIIVYDITSKHSFQQVTKYVEQIIKVLTTEQELPSTNSDSSVYTFKPQQHHQQTSNSQMTSDDGGNEDTTEIKHKQCLLPLILVGNKCDLEDKRQVSRNEGQELAEKYGMIFIETSAKSNSNVDVAFLALSREILKKPKPQKKRYCLIQ